MLRIRLPRNRKEGFFLRHDAVLILTMHWSQMVTKGYPKSVFTAFGTGTFSVAQEAWMLASTHADH